ncbi:cysteine desulfurase family protein [Companilactobacillus halodurans]|uniref:Cysteine desulfurase n=1 Tax=Companilactobacillus halodurans TaxID=2584183 RepID=A0A5P0ZWE1_9LACO|nr:cysteine desulfurase family protein [Companilactobacillus halodurans]MQS74967.1 cysteine desulfurase [Companilactobacillus halodurans]MQS97162.1 cysteine desulfurase [Companilactobacillus halodurans]
MIYFDNSATTKINDSVLKTYNLASTEYFGNPSSLHKLGLKAYELLETSRKQIANLMHVKQDEIVFTSGGTEGNNWVIKGTAFKKREFGKHIITTEIEHASVLNVMHQLEELGFEVTYLPVDKSGHISADDLKKAIRKDTILVSTMAVNNEIGAVQPIHEIAEVLKDYPSISYHVDAIQAIGKGLESQIIDPRVDFYTFSGHKFHAPRGTGFIYMKEGKQLEPLMAGGGQESNLRSGTENTPGIAAMAKALRLLKDDEAGKAKKMEQLKDKLIKHLQTLDNVHVFSKVADNFAPHIICFTIDGVRGETIVHTFEERDIYISTTSACSSKKGLEAGTLKAMNVQENIATSAVRVSLDESNTEKEMDEFIKNLDEIHDHFQILN